MNIPFLDLITPHRELEEELIAVFRDCIHNASFVGGPQVQSFEEEFAQFCETKYCVAVNSGTDALRFAMIAVGMGPGDEVITVPNTFIATTEAISQTGATPAFVDIDERTYNLDPNKLEDHIKKRFKEKSPRKKVQKPKKQGSKSADLAPLTLDLEPNTSHLSPLTFRLAPKPKAVLPVHLYGQPADMDSILEIADRYGLIVIEDACQAHGAEYFSKKENQWRKAGSMGIAGCFSFYPGKNLGACGEGGAVTTNNEEIAQKIRMLRDHGQAKKYYHEFEGYNGRLDAIQTGILRVKLKHLPEWNEKRRHNASLYNECFKDQGSRTKDNLEPLASSLGPWIIIPYEPSWSRAVYHLYIIRTQKRDELQKYLSENGISTGLHYPIPLHLQNAYKNLNVPNGNYPITEKVSNEILSLPMFPDLTATQIEYVVQKIKEFASSLK
jgi:dTDP-4-amino-4,6-dideoxygalactose transaminase